MRNARGVSLSWAVLLGLSVFFLGCNSSSNSNAPASAVRSYNGTASVGDFLTISIDSAADTITYHNLTNGESGTVPYTVNADGTYTITDPQGNLLTAYEVPGFVLMVESAKAGPNQDTPALITAVETTPVTRQTFAGKNFNDIQFRTSDGGVEIGTVSIDGSGNIQNESFIPSRMLWSNTYVQTGSFPASSITEDPTGNFFTVHESNGSDSVVFGTQNGLWAVDTSHGAVLGLPKASTKEFDPAAAGTYTAIYYQKTNAQMAQNGAYESGTPVQGKATVTISSNGSFTITDSQNNTLASGTLMAVADTSYIYDGTSNMLTDPCFGLFTSRLVTATSHQDVFVAFQGKAVLFGSFQTPLPITQGGGSPYNYFYGVGLK